MSAISVKRFTQLLKSRKEAIVDIFLEQIFDYDRNQEWGLKPPDESQRVELRQNYCEPLFRLLVDGMVDDRIKHVYFDERLRFAPHRESADRRVKFHRASLDAEFAVLSRGLKEHQVEKAAAEWYAFHRGILDDKNSKFVVLTVGDCLMTEIRVFINRDVEQGGAKIDFRCMYFNASASGGFDIASIEKYLSSHKVDAIAISFFTFDAMPGFRRLFEGNGTQGWQAICDEYLDLCESFLGELGEIFKGQFFVHNVSGLPLSRLRRRIPFMAPFSVEQRRILSYLNDGIKDRAKGQRNVIIVDEVSTVKSQGVRALSKAIASQRLYGGRFHTSELGYQIASEYRKHIDQILRFAKCKVLLIDFDNTLWKGVMAEGPVDHNRSRQRLLLDLKNRGILLAAISKNNSEVIRWEEMAIGREDFVAEKISWQPKVDSIRMLADELSLGLDSFVFIDDSHHERAMVENELPDVRCYDADDPNVWEGLALLLSTPLVGGTAESANRTSMYREQAQRKEVLRACSDPAAMFQRLGLMYRFSVDRHDDLDRIVELVTRTNQFNTTTKRYSRTSIEEMQSDENWRVCTFSLSDKIGSLGVVGVVLCKINMDKTAVIDSLIMSCRAMGFGLERQMVHDVVKLLGRLGSESIRAWFFPTDRNSPCADLFASLGFVCESPEVFRIDKSEFNSLSSVDWLSRID